MQSSERCIECNVGVECIEGVECNVGIECIEDWTIKKNISLEIFKWRVLHSVVKWIPVYSLNSLSDSCEQDYR